MKTTMKRGPRRPSHRRYHWQSRKDRRTMLEVLEQEARELASWATGIRPVRRQRRHLEAA